MSNSLLGGAFPILKQSPEAIRNEIRSYLERRAVVNNELIGKGVVLDPPRHFSVNALGDTTEVVISSGKSSFRTTCTRVVLSKYRLEIAFVIDKSTGPPEIKKLTPLRPARRKMLNAVPPHSGLTPPDFYAETQSDTGSTQVNARRRWGELRTEYGFDTTYDGGRFSRGDERPVQEPSPRPDQGMLNSDYWLGVYAAHSGLCNKCGKKIRLEDMVEGEAGLLDHRRPVVYGGGDERSNL